VNLVILGATGSIGGQTLDIARRRGHRVVGVSARHAGERLWRVVDEFRPEVYAFDEGEDRAGPGRRIAGPRALEELALWPSVDVVVVAVNGFDGLPPMLAALGAGRRVAAATKEAIIAGGGLLHSALAEGLLIPVDSEHAAAFQLLQGRRSGDVRRLILTTSGGALRDWPLERLPEATPSDALAHPNWSMGALVTINSATLVNKGIEIMEAHVLFDLPFERLDVWVHRAQLAHALLETRDGALFAALARPDMHLPIEQALTFPTLPEDGLAPLEPEDMQCLTFQRPDPARYPSLRLCLDAGKIGGTMPAVLCAANELAVESFLAGAVRFTEIVPTVAEVLALHESLPGPGLTELREADRWARRTAQNVLRRRAGR